MRGESNQMELNDNGTPMEWTMEDLKTCAQFPYCLTAFSHLAAGKRLLVDSNLIISFYYISNQLNDSVVQKQFRLKTLRLNLLP